MIADPILITGVGRRAGFHVARAFLQRGMPVIGTYRTWYPRLEELEQLGADLYHCDFDRQDEVDLLIGDASKAKAMLNWSANTTIDELVSEMVQSDVETVKKYHYLKNGGFEVLSAVEDTQ